MKLIEEEHSLDDAYFNMGIDGKRLQVPDASRPEKARSIELVDESFFYNEHCVDEVCLTDPKEGPKFITYIEGLVRTSPSYKVLTRHLRYTRKLNRCSIYQNIYHRYDAMVELHHYPFTLWDIVHAVAKKMAILEGDEYFFPMNKDFALAKEVLRLHFASYVTLIPLCATWHDAYHGGCLFIPLDKVLPSYKKFNIEFRPFLSDCAIEKLRIMDEMTREHRIKGEADIPMGSKLMVTRVTIDGQDMISIKEKVA